ncbi:MAG: CUAEP/CCAEP-tail radical SAM protein [Ardenticatenaceae bacterium]|nr:CUAEP/CCAEP-tail radical SAM protein [Ardenticatenaceae bacterium]HBY98028.1 radical SAM protein [Chloroflexota bacterium]
MRAPGAILFVACYELGHQPLSLASPMGMLAQAGYRPVAVDTAVERLDSEQVRQARFVAISVPMHTAMRLGQRVAERVRALNPDAHICFYGLYAVLNADKLLVRWADSVIGGEFEQPLLELVQRLARGEPAHGPGVGVPGQPAQPYLRRIPFAPPLRTALPPLERYAHLERNGQHSLAGYVEASRGCLHTCLHCPITPVYRGRFFVVPFEVVLEDIHTQVAMGARHITFGDPDFFNGPGHSMRIVRALHAEFPGVTFDATIKIEHILERRALFPELAELGCAFVVSAVESLSDEVLARLAKGHTRADVEAALDILEASGIPLRPSLVAFTPWTTMEGYLEVLTFVESHRLIQHIDPVQYTIRLLVPPGSALLDQPGTAAWLGPLDAEAFTYRWEHPDPRMDDLYREVSALVERATRGGWPTERTFEAIKMLAFEAAGQPLPEPSLAIPALKAPAPRLTESWFC